MSAVFASETVYGRDVEVQQLEQAFHRVLGYRTNSTLTTTTTTTNANCNETVQEVVILRGYSGTGKTFLAQTLRPHVRKVSGIFATGKFSLNGSQRPYAVFIAILNQVIDELLGDIDSRTPSHTYLPLVQQSVKEALGSEATIITNLIPSVKRLIGENSNEAHCDVRGSEAVHQLHLVYCKLCRAIASIVPLVLFLDDMQWSDPASLGLFQALLDRPSPALGHVDVRPSLLILAAFREEDIEEDSRNKKKDDAATSKTAWQQCHQHLQQPTVSSHCNITTIHLSTLNESSLNDMIAGTLKISLGSSLRLARHIHEVTGGNPFHAVQYLHALLDRGEVAVFDDESQSSNEGNLHISSGEALTMNAIETIDTLVQNKLDGMSDFSQRLLQVAACIGDDIDEIILATIFDGQVQEISNSLAVARDHELLVFDKMLHRYRFVHDHIRQVVLAGVKDKGQLYFETGYKLWQHLSPSYFDAKLFTIVNLLNHGINRLTDEDERYNAAALNHEAGVKATSLAAFPDAARYLAAGIAFLSGSDYWNKNYSLSLNLFNSAADAELCNQNFIRVKNLVHEIFEHARTPRDKMIAYAAQINATGQLGNVNDAVTMGLNALRELGEKTPPRVTTLTIVSEIIKTKLALRGKTDNDLLSLPPMVDENKIGAVHIWNLLLPYTFQAGSPLVVLCGTRVVRLSTKYGIAKGTANGFVTLAWVLCRSERKEGYRFGKLAMSLIEKLRAREQIPHLSQSFYFFTHHWTRPLRESLEPLEHSFHVAVDVGDVEYASYSISFYCANCLRACMSLDMLEEKFIDAIDFMHQYQQENSVQIPEVILQYIQSLRGKATNPLKLSNIHEDSTNVSVLSLRCTLGAELAYLFGDYDLAEQLVQQRLSYNWDFFALYDHAMNTFYDGLIAVARARQGINQRKNIKDVNQALKKLVSWSKDCPYNFLNKKYLLEAELKSLQASTLSMKKTLLLYDQAIEFGMDQGFSNEAAMACERAGDFLNRHEDEKEAQIYLEKARLLYEKWGATAKLNQLNMNLVTAT